MANEPITEGISFEIDAQAENADKQRLQEILKMAEERLPCHVQHAASDKRECSNNIKNKK